MSGRTSDTLRALRERRSVDYTAKANHNELPDWLKTTSYAYMTATAERKLWGATTASAGNLPGSNANRQQKPAATAPKRKRNHVQHAASQSQASTPRSSPHKKRKPPSTKTHEVTPTSKTPLPVSSPLAQHPSPNPKQSKAAMHNERPVRSGTAAQLRKSPAKRQWEPQRGKQGRNKVGINTRQSGARRLAQVPTPSQHDLLENVSQLLQATRASVADLGQLKKDFHQLKKGFSDFKSVYFHQQEQLSKEVETLRGKSKKR